MEREYKFSETSRANMSFAAKNRPKVSDETKRKMSEAARNKKPISEETKRKMSEAARARWSKYYEWLEEQNKMNGRVL